MVIELMIIYFISFTITANDFDSEEEYFLNDIESETESDDSLSPIAKNRRRMNVVYDYGYTGNGNMWTWRFAWEA